MGVDGIKPKTAASVGPTVEAKKAEPVKLEPAYKPPEPAKLAQEGFDLLKKKLMSVSGRYAAHKPMVSERADLKQQISGQRSVVHANAGSAPGTVSKSSKIDAGHVHGADCGCGTSRWRSPPFPAGSIPPTAPACCARSTSPPGAAATGSSRRW